MEVKSSTYWGTYENKTYSPLPQYDNLINELRIHVNAIIHIWWTLVI